MFIGARYKLQDKKEQSSFTTLGYKTIEIRERVLFRTNIKDNEHESYDYMLYCIVDGNDTAEILEDELSSEIVSGIYKYDGEKI